MAKKIIIGVLLLVVLIVGVSACSILSEYTRKESGKETVTVVIPKGSSEKQIAEILKDNGVIDYTITFRLKMKSSPYRGQLKYGTYILNKKMCLDDLIETISKPGIDDTGIRITIPEGYSAEMIALKCEEAGIVKSEDFLKELSEGVFDYEFIKDIPDADGVKYKLQGYLFPSTYIFRENSDAHTVINTFLGEFEKQYNSVKAELPDNMSMNEAVVRASLIEREAKLDSERETISGVIQNRIEKGMLLQIDATVVYAISEGLYDVDRVLYKDLETDSLYNTYKYPGLPVGAICNAGIESIRAAMTPEKHSYLYYHTDTDKNDGSHIFTETFAEHSR